MLTCWVLRTQKKGELGEVIIPHNWIGQRDSQSLGLLISTVHVLLMVSTEAPSISAGFWDKNGTGTLPFSSLKSQGSRMNNHLYKGAKTSSFSYRSAREQGCLHAGRTEGTKGSRALVASL